MTRVALAFLWLAHFLPLRLLAMLGQTVGMLLYAAALERRRVVRTNLRLCFPEESERAREALVRRHFRVVARSFLERALGWWAPVNRIERLVRIEGLEHWRAVSGRSAILLAPHFVGCDIGGLRLSLEQPMVTIYSQQKNAVLDAVLRKGRKRAAHSQLYSRQEGLRPVIRAMRQGHSFYYLPDMDLGARDALFVPFFGTSAATVTGLSRLAAITGAVVVPCVTRQLPGGDGYVVRYYPFWEGFPSGDLGADVRRMNAFIEERVLEMPEQYYWVHKRFKTRPPGEASPYDC